MLRDRLIQLSPRILKTVKNGDYSIQFGIWEQPTPGRRCDAKRLLAGARLKGWHD